MVRTSRFVQNGMVISSIHSPRDRGLRVAMNQAVGTPMISVSTVVAAASPTDRPRITRCACDSDTVSSKMSRSHRTDSQPCSDGDQTTPP